MRRAGTTTCLALAFVLAGPACGLGIADGPAAIEKQYEMTTYWVGFLRRGPAWTPGQTPETQKIQEGHMANIRKMAAAGKLVVAGPFKDDGDLRGMFVFTVANEEEARTLVAEDPAVKSGRLVMDLHPWFAAKGIRVDPCPSAGK